MYNIIIKCIIHLCKCAREAAIYGFNFLCELLGIGTDTNNILDGFFKPKLYRIRECSEYANR